MINEDNNKYKHIEIDGKIYRRNTTYFDNNKYCHDCGIENKIGNLHIFFCDMERCPKCRGQLLSCGCSNKRLLNTDKSVSDFALFIETSTHGYLLVPNSQIKVMFPNLYKKLQPEIFTYGDIMFIEEDSALTTFMEGTKFTQEWFNGVSYEDINVRDIDELFENIDVAPKFIEYLKVNYGKI
jgi:hypothetical protein